MPFLQYNRFYLDTSFFGGCFDKEYELWANHMMVDFRDRRIQPIVSDVVAAEILLAPPPVQQKYLEVFACDYEFVLVEPEALALADLFLKRRMVSPRQYQDGIHLAIATLVQADLVVSCNLQKIFTFNKTMMFTLQEGSLGTRSLPTVFSPADAKRMYDKPI